MAILDLIILLVAVFSLAMIQAPILVWTISLGIILFLITVFGVLGSIVLTICWLVFLSVAAFANLGSLRKQFFTKPFSVKLQKNMPPISPTEREAIDAGNVWWEKDLFCGRPQWKKFLALPRPTLTTVEQAFLDNEVETLCGMLNDWDIVNEHKNLPEAVWAYLKSQGFFGMAIPKEYGGRGFSALAHSTVVTKIATRSVSAAVTTMVPNSLGPGELVLHYGTQQQKDYYLPRLAVGQEIPCFALTSPDAGSDAGAIKDSGTLCYDLYEGKKVLGIRLSWDKRYITLAPVATVLGVAFRLNDPQHLLSEKEDIGITLCLIPTSHPGVEIGHRHWPLHMAFMNGPTRGKDVFIPADWVIGGLEKAGQGWKMLMECLSVGRSISLPALSTACGYMTYRMTGGYSRIRKQFNLSIAHFEGIEEALSEIAGFTYTLEACRQLTCSAVDQHISPAICSAIAKYHMTEMARKVVAHAMDINSGQAIQVGPRNYLANAHIAIPISITVEGANILTRNLIIFGQGAIRCHPYILNEVELLSAPDSPEKINKLDKLLMSHMGYTISNLFRSCFAGWTGGLFLHSPTGGVTAKYYRQLSRMSIALALLSDMCMLLLGGDLKRRERISARLGDILSELYLASAILKFYQDQGQIAADVSYMQWGVQNCLANIQMACDALFENFPSRWLGGFLRFIIFPFGTAYRKPKDKLSHEIVSAMIAPSELRQRLTQFCYMGKTAQEPTYKIEEALAKTIAIEPLLKKFQQGIRNAKLTKQFNFHEQTISAFNAGILTKDEVNQLDEYFTLYEEVIAVDEFSFDLSKVMN